MHQCCLLSFQTRHYMLQCFLHAPAAAKGVDISSTVHHMLCEDRSVCVGHCCHPKFSRSSTRSVVIHRQAVKTPVVQSEWRCTWLGGKPFSIRITRLANLAMLSSREVMLSCVKGVCAHVQDSSAHSLLLVHSSSRSSIFRKYNSYFAQ